jgi:hypothetical protein
MKRRREERSDVAIQEPVSLDGHAPAGLAMTDLYQLRLTTMTLVPHVMARSVATWPSRMVGFIPAARLDGHASLAMTRKGPRVGLKKIWYYNGAA